MTVVQMHLPKWQDKADRWPTKAPELTPLRLVTSSKHEHPFTQPRGIAAALSFAGTVPWVPELLQVHGCKEPSSREPLADLRWRKNELA
jgi:hypothetical protein